MRREEDGSEESLGYTGNLQENSSASSSSVSLISHTDLFNNNMWSCLETEFVWFLGG